MMDFTLELMNKIEEARKIAIKHPSLAFEMSKEAFDIARMHELRQGEAYALFVMALACRSMTKLNDCYNYAYDAFKKYETMDDPTGLAAALNLIGIVYYYNAMYEAAIEHFLKALHLIEETEDYITLSRLYNNMGEVYREVGNLDDALISYSKGLDLSEKYNYTTNMAVILENIGEVYFLKADYSYSFECYKKSYDILVKAKDVTALAEVENRMGKIYFIQQQYDKARACYNHALAQLEEIENKYFTIDVLINMAELEIIENEELFLSYLIKAIEYGEEINARKKLSQIYKMINEFYEKKGDFELALEFYKRFHMVEQEIETAVVSQKLEIIKIELSKLLGGEEVEKIVKLNKQLEQEIAHQNKLLEGMEKANRNLRLEVLSDELTNIPNRRGVKSHLALAWRQSEEKPFNAALLMIDIDYFKRYNDYYGHLEGDVCIKRIADTLKSVFGNRNGIVGRYGGEEYVCFIKDSEFKDVLELSEFIRSAVEKLDMKYLWDETWYPITISIGGIYGCSSHFDNMTDLFSIADEELYKAKNEGRNKIFLRDINMKEASIK
ncbi:MAG TPA: tetratricopeptide repeat-containing diguanylate cyclase [Patescibacteria group bacterium]|nr:tetratricopeptide repeat-containing diguanylate cyclase [Patescibacteria group bacterium]